MGWCLGFYSFKEHSIDWDSIQYCMHLLKFLLDAGFLDLRHGLCSEGFRSKTAKV